MAEQAAPHVEQAALHAADPQDNATRENPIPSHESSNTHVPPNADRPELILPAQAHLPYAPNNHFLDVENDRMHNVLRSILRRHPLLYALSAQADVPEIYVQQAWHTMVFIHDHQPPRIAFHVDRFEAFLNFRRLRDVLQLPMPDSRPGFIDYEPFPSEAEVFQGIMDLGYRGNLTKVREFTKKNLPPKWHDLFMILNRCLTSKAFGSDSASLTLLKMFHAVAYNLHANFTFLVWLDLTERITEKAVESKKKKYLPFPRFLGLFIDRMMQANPEIPTRANFPRSKVFAMTHFRPPKAAFAYQRDFPVDMLVQYARIEDPDVRAYCESRGIELPAAAAVQAPQAPP